MGSIPSKITVAIVYHSGFGHTARQARAVAEGVESVAGAELLFVTIGEDEIPWDKLEQADAIIFGTPTYMGGPSAQFKAFQDSTSRPVFAAGRTWKNKVAAGFTNSASHAGDKLATFIQLAVFAAEHGMHWINLDLPPGNNSSTGSPDNMNRLGFWMGAAAASNADESPEVAPPESDLRTARYMGARVAEVTWQLARGKAAS